MKQERQAVLMNNGFSHDSSPRKPSAPESVTPRPGGNGVRGRADKLRREPANEAMKPIDLSAPESFKSIDEFRKKCFPKAHKNCSENKHVFEIVQRCRECGYYAEMVLK